MPLEIPLHLYQVLEEEYISLHGPIPADGELIVELPEEENGHRRRKVMAKLDWLFHQGHIKDPVGLALALLPYTDVHTPPDRTMPDVQAYDWMKENLKRYLCGKINAQTLAALRDWRPPNSDSSSLPIELVQRLETELNEVLKDRELYRSDRFSLNWLGDASRALIPLLSIYESMEEKDLTQINRILLEDAFPEYLEKIYNIRLTAMYQRLHGVEQKALALSGGGIRSGTFALGLLQGLARHNLLKGFDYLSTVSGGGYIGSWLTAWIHRHPGGLNGVTTELANSAPVSKVDPDPQPIRYLRDYSSFITPRVGLLTADTWAFIAIYFRNLLLNWLVFIPLLISVLMIPRLILTITLQQPESPAPLVTDLLGVAGLILYGRHIFLALGFVAGVWALAFIGFNRPGVRELLRKRSPFWRNRTDQKSFLLFCLLPLLISAVCLTTYWAWSREKSDDSKHIFIFLLFGLAFTFLGWLVASLILRRLFRWQEINKLELGALLLAGPLGGLFFWIVSQQRIGNPVIGYNKNFDWTNWTGWLAWKTELYVCFGVPFFLLVFLLATTFFVGVSSNSPRIDDEDREWWARCGAWLLISIIAWSVFNCLVIFGPVALLSFPSLLTSVGGLSGLLAILAGRSSKTPSQATPDNEKSKGGLLAGLMSRLLPVLALVFILIFMASLSLLTTGIIRGLAVALAPLSGSEWVEWLTNVPAPGFSRYIGYIYPHAHPSDSFIGAKIVHLNVLHHSSTWFVLGLGLLFLAFGMGLSKLINLNLFSLHAGYRNRLIRAFLGASRPIGERKPNPFTGFDPADNIHMHELRAALFDERDFINPERLAAALQDTNQPLSRYLSEKNLLENLKTLPPPASSSPRLVNALRKDLNVVLESEQLYAQDLSPHLLETEKALQIREDIKAERPIQSLDKSALRHDYHILLNRLALEEAYPNLIQPCRCPPYKMMHLINTTLNLVGGDNLAWQQRKAEPFSITPLHAGCFRLGYRNSRDYGGKETSGISIGTAAAISGAAASSNMGYYTTSPVLSLVLTLFNVRLGWWLGNPGPAGDETYELRAPKYSVAPVIDEAFGLTDDKNKYVYLTDGGHFENLAIYEMVLRRCHLIVVSDGAQDEQYRFTDLGNAVRKIRIDLGVPIEFTSVPIYAESPPLEKGKGMYWAIGKIRYSCIDSGPDVKDGVLLYLKPAVYGNEPRDILEYKKSFPAFPHQSTADQFFDEPQFESYRMLGSYIMDQLCGEGTEELDLYEVIDKAFYRLTEKADGMPAVDPQLEKWLREWLRRKD